MNHNLRTLGFVAAAGLLSAVAGFSWNASRPPEQAAAADLGKPLFADLEKGELAPESLEVHALDKDGRPQSFMVQKKNGVWLIPSHNNYPAEAADRLARTTTGLAALVRRAIDSQSDTDHAKRGVLDPMNPENNDPDTAGKRVVVKGPGGIVLADLIVGKSAGEGAADAAGAGIANRNRPELFFIRKSDESNVYRVPLQLDLTTRFADWIDPSLLKFDEALPLALRFDNYRIEEEKDPLGRTVGLVQAEGEEFVFSRTNPAGNWELAPGKIQLDGKTEQLNQSALNGLPGAVEALRVRGVRPKFTYQGEQLITPELRLNTASALVSDRSRFSEALTRLQSELSSRGFNLIPKDRSKQELDLVAENGELELGLSDGLRYFLYFGKTVKGTEQSIEIGDSSGEIGESADNAEGEKPAGVAQANAEGAVAPAEGGGSTPADAGGEADKVASDATASEAEEDEEENRYLMIRVAVDESLLGPLPPAPEAPTEPVKPEGYVPAPATPESKPGEPPTEPVPDTRADNFKDYDGQLAVFQQARMEYEIAAARHKNELETWNTKRDAATSRAKDLNDRFGSWYYVISGRKLSELRMGRAELVTKTEVPSAPPADELPPIPDIRFEGTPMEEAIPETVPVPESAPTGEDAPKGDGQPAGSPTEPSENGPPSTNGGG